MQKIMSNMFPWQVGKASQSNLKVFFFSSHLISTIALQDAKDSEV